jgi:hypothetical protein
MHTVAGQVREVAVAAGVAVAGENALPCFMPGSIDEVALQRVIYNTQVGLGSRNVKSLVEVPAWL